MLQTVIFSAVGLAALGAFLVTLLFAQRLRLAQRERTRLKLADQLRPWAIALVEGEIQIENLPSLNREEVRVLAELLTRYAHNLTGTAREHIATYFESSGGVAQELKTLKNRSTWKRATAAYTLGNMASSTAIPGLLEALNDGKREVRSVAARSLGQLQAEHSVQALVEAISTTAVPRTIAGQALLKIGPAAIPELSRLIQHPDEGVRATAIELAGLLGDVANEDLLLERLRDDSAEVRAQAAETLGRIGAEHATVALKESLKDRIPSVRAAVAHSLGVVGDRSATSALAAQAREDQFDAAQAAARSIARIDPDFLLKASDDSLLSDHLKEARDLMKARVI